MATTTGHAFLDRRLELLTAGNYEELVDAGYNDDALLLDVNGPVRGRAALKEHFRTHLGALGGVELRSINQLVDSGDCLLVELTVLTGTYGEVTSIEGFVLSNGRADYHFTALK